MIKRYLALATSLSADLNFIRLMRSLLALLLFFLFCTGAHAQKAISFGQAYELRSEILGENRVLNVLLPAEYADSSSNRYPVVYLLDGATDEDFFHAAGLVRYLDDHGMMPPTILVGIANVDRKRDFTYPSHDPRDVRDFPTTGGSAKFIDFLQYELPTYVERTFRTTKHRTLIGQSLGGLLATEVLLKHPGHFNDYVIVSPSLWWDLEGLYKAMDSLVSALTVYPERLFVCGLQAAGEPRLFVSGSDARVRIVGPEGRELLVLDDAPKAVTELVEASGGRIFGLSRLPGSPFLAKESQMPRAPDHTVRLDAHQFRITRPQPCADHLAHVTQPCSPAH